MSGAGIEWVWVYDDASGGFAVGVVWRRSTVGVGQLFGMLGGKESGSILFCGLGLK